MVKVFTFTSTPTQVIYEIANHLEMKLQITQKQSNPLPVARVWHVAQPARSLLPLTLVHQLSASLARTKARTPSAGENRMWHQSKITFWRSFIKGWLGDDRRCPPLNCRPWLRPCLYHTQHTRWALPFREINVLPPKKMDFFLTVSKGYISSANDRWSQL